MKEKRINSQILVLALAFSAAFLLNSCGDQTREEIGATGQTGTEYEAIISYGTAVDTLINSQPANPTDANFAVFTFSCNKKRCSYQCKLGKQAWKTCFSSKIYKGLADGVHTFRVKAKNLANNTWDKTPASYSWTISGGGWIGSSVSAGGYHTCALTSSGGVKCWGQNGHGQLGNGTNAWSNVPVNVSGLSSGVSAISGGYKYTCAVTSGGAVKCWGDNWAGQLGNGTDTDSNVPVNVSGLSSGVSAISAGSDHTCALTSGGGAKCWGYNGYGSLGNGTDIDYSNVPLDVYGLSSGVIAISAGYDCYSCALTSSGGVKCWGGNWNSQLGNDTIILYSNVPVNVSGLASGVSAISAGGGHTCALTSGGGAKCWGGNGAGQLGNGTRTGSNVPVNVSGLSSGISAISAGSVHTCALTSGGGAKCWGYNYWGQLGNGTAGSNFDVPVNVIGFGP